MSHPTPNRALRRMVADLAALRAEDLAAILGELDAGERQVIEGLLRDYASYADIGRTRASRNHIAYDASRLSPWLAQRLQAADRPGHEITPQVRQALSDCVARLYPACPMVSNGRPSLLGRMVGVLLPRRQAT